MSKKLIFVRHAKSKGNVTHPEKGIKFIGRFGNHNIIPPEKEKINDLRKITKDYSIVFSSPAKRCKQSLELITDKEIIENEKLQEINYGDVDNLYLKEIQERYSYLFEGWENEQDPKFPNGENTQDVIDRYKSFLNELKEYEGDKILVCTHNVFLRSVLGDALHIPMKNWFKISIPHFEALEFELNNNEVLYKGNEEQKNKILKNF